MSEDPRVEVVAKTLSDMFNERAESPSVWEHEDECWKEDFRADARRVLAAIDEGVAA